MATAGARAQSARLGISLTRRPIRAEMNNNASISRVYIDESIHSDLGFIASAMVFDTNNLEDLVSDALRSAGMRPGIDEYKSGVIMRENPIGQALRDRILRIAGSDVKLAVLFSPANARSDLGQDILKHLTIVCQRNGILSSSLQAYFDEGLFSSAKQAQRIAGTFPEFEVRNLNFEQDSRQILGIQVADNVAHSLSQILKPELTDNRKTTLVGEDSGYLEGTEVDLDWSLLMSLRYTLFHRTVIYEKDQEGVIRATNPKIISDEDDIVEYAQHPELFGYGIFVAPNLLEQVRSSIEDRFAKIWLGCIH